MEFPSVGEHCAHPHCSQLNFLPLQCVYCKSVFCSEHNLPLAHSCSKYTPNVLEEKTKKEKWQFECNEENCNVKELVEMKCIKCNLHFCLNHRHADQHNCAYDKPAPSPFPTSKEAALKQLEEAKSSIFKKLEESKNSGGAKGAMATKLALMKLKGRAVGDPKVPTQCRIYFSIECPNKGQNPKPLELYLSKEWSMGKSIEFITLKARIKNKNHLAGERKIHLFRKEALISDPFDKILGDLAERGEVEDGETLELKYVEA